MSSAITFPRRISGGTRSRTVVSAEAHTQMLPRGREMYLAGRGTTFVRELSGPPGAPVVMLLHGWGSTADLTWNHSYRALAHRYRVIALDHRGHGRGMSTTERFRLEDCADDVVALADSLGIERFIPVGYSMGGPIASLIWRRHGSRVDGLVLCATSRRFNHKPSRRAAFAMLNGTSSLASLGPFRSIGQVSQAAWSRRLEHRQDGRWAIEQIGRHDWPQVLAAGHEIGRFDSTDWIGGVDVPTAVVGTRRDEVVPTVHQIALANAINDSTLHLAQGGHIACSVANGQFVAALVNACGSVAERVERLSAPSLFSA